MVDRDWTPVISKGHTATSSEVELPRREITLHLADAHNLSEVTYPSGVFFDLRIYGNGLGLDEIQNVHDRHHEIGVPGGEPHDHPSR